MAQQKKKTRKTAKKSTAKDSDWHLKRDVFFRPGRMKYVRKLDKPTGCVFCTSGQGKTSFETLCVYKTQYSQIVLNKYPYNNGHVLVLPLDHIGQLLELSPERFDDLHRTLRVAVEAIQKIYEPNGFNIGLNHGLAGGAGIPEHLHYHIVPRWSGDLNFFPLIAEIKVVIETLEESYDKFNAYFKKAQG